LSASNSSRVGLDYLVARPFAATLSGGEARFGIRLATADRPACAACSIVLDEPSIGRTSATTTALDRAGKPAATSATPVLWWSTTRTPSAKADYVLDHGPRRRP